MDLLHQGKLKNVDYRSREKGGMSTQLDPSSLALESISAAELGLPAENQVS